MSELDRCIELLRYVDSGYYVASQDHNTVVDCLKAARRVVVDRFGWVPGVDPLVDELDEVLGRIRYVKSLDIILPEDHNYVVDALKKVRDILFKVEGELERVKVLQHYASEGIGDPRPPSTPSVPPTGSRALMAVHSYASHQALTHIMLYAERISEETALVCSDHVD